MSSPPIRKRNDRYFPNTGDDPAAMLVNPNRLRRPQLISGDRTFTWPIGIEGFQVTGRSTLSLHHPIGRNVVGISLVHLDEGRITMDGEFYGLTAVENMVKLRDVCMAAPPANGKLLIFPKVFEEVQYVMTEEYSFVHNADDYTHSIAYTLSMVRIGSKGDVDEFENLQAPQQPGNNNTDRGTPNNPPSGSTPGPGDTVTSHGVSVYLTTETTATFREVAALKLGSADRYKELIELNRPQGGFLIPSHELPTHRFPPGTGIIIKRK